MPDMRGRHKRVPVGFPAEMSNSTIASVTLWGEVRRDFCQREYSDRRWPEYGALPCGAPAIGHTNGAGYCAAHDPRRRGNDNHQ